MTSPDHDSAYPAYAQLNARTDRPAGTGTPHETPAGARKDCRSTVQPTPEKRRSTQAADTASSTWRQLGIPWRDSGGK